VFPSNRVGTFRTEDQVKLACNGHRDRIHAPRAQNLKISVVLRSDANIVYVIVRAAVFDDQIGLPFYRQRANLVKVRGVFESAGSDRFLEKKRFVDELDRGYKHSVRVSSYGVEVKWPIRVTFLRLKSKAARLPHAALNDESSE
jgi:hypothetical protein